MKFFKILMIITLTIASFSLLGSTVGAEEINQLNPSEIENSQLIIDNSQNQIGTYSTNKITIWFKGAVVGALSLGTFIYITGKAPEEWVTWGLTAMEKKIKNFANSSSYVKGKPIYVASNGNIHACVVYPCAIAANIDEPEMLGIPKEDQLAE